MGSSWLGFRDVFLDVLLLLGCFFMIGLDKLEKTGILRHTFFVQEKLYICFLNVLNGSLGKIVFHGDDLCIWEGPFRMDTWKFWRYEI